MPTTIPLNNIKEQRIPPLSQLNTEAIKDSIVKMLVIFGATLAATLAQSAGSRYWPAAICCLLLAAAGLWTVGSMAATSATDKPGKLVLQPTGVVRTILSIRHDNDLLLAVAGQAWFMFVGAFTQLNLISYGMQKLGLTEIQSGYFFLAAAGGLSCGTLLAARLSGRDVEFGIVPLGAIGLSLSLTLLHTVPATFFSSLAILISLGISAGLFSLPLQTFIRLRAEPARRSEVLNTVSFINWLAILAASGLAWFGSDSSGFSAAESFCFAGALTMIMMLISFRVLPDFFVRFVALVTIRLFYRLRISGAENLPVDGPALLIPNHVTWVDALLLTATNQRRIRFVMERRIYNRPFLRWFFRLMGVIPVSSGDSKKELAEFVRAARQALDDGFLVCIFAEGSVTRNGLLSEFRSGFERIVKDSGYPIIPAYIGGAWGSIFSYAHGRLLSRLPACATYPITILFGTPMVASSSASEVRHAVMELSRDYSSFLVDT